MSEKLPGESGTSPKHVFMYLLLIAMLYVSVVSLIMIIFQYINILIPDSLNTYTRGFYETIRYASSSLIVAFPVYILMTFLLQKEYRRIPEAKQLKTRKWLVYLTLFVAAITIIIDLIQLINNFYSGELTWSFALKVLTVLIVALAVFGYHLWDLQKEIVSKTRKIIGSSACIVVLLVIVAGFFIAGSPAHQRKMRFDEQRINHLQSLQFQILNYWLTTGRLPNHLADLTDTIQGYIPMNDPVTNESYGYEIKSDFSFTLCATFETDATSESVPKPYYPMHEWDDMGGIWNHGIGKTCFDRTIDPERHKVLK